MKRVTFSLNVFGWEQIWFRPNHWFRRGNPMLCHFLQSSVCSKASDLVCVLPFWSLAFVLAIAILNYGRHILALSPFKLFKTLCNRSEQKTDELRQVNVVLLESTASDFLTLFFSFFGITVYLIYYIIIYVHSNTSHSITQGSHASIPADSELWMQSSLLPLMKASCTQLWCFSSAEFKVVLFQFNLVQKDAIQCVWRGLTPQLIEHLASTINDHTLYDVVCRLKRNMSHQGR